jgi:hypothetical protein
MIELAIAPNKASIVYRSHSQVPIVFTHMETYLLPQTFASTPAKASPLKPNNLDNKQQHGKLPIKSHNSSRKTHPPPLSPLPSQFFGSENRIQTKLTCGPSANGSELYL